MNEPFDTDFVARVMEPEPLPPKELCGEIGSPALREWRKEHPGWKPAIDAPPEHFVVFEVYRYFVCSLENASAVIRIGNVPFLLMGPDKIEQVDLQGTVVRTFPDVIDRIPPSYSQ
jgi:hypothetical protein